MSQNIRLKPELEVRSRQRVLYDVIIELARAFSLNTPENVFEVIKKGVFQKQYFSAIGIYLIGTDDKCVAEIKLKIDWDVHKVKISSGESEFQIDTNRSILDQISSVYSVITKHITQLKNSFKITRSEFRYFYRSDILYEEARRYCGTVEVESVKFSDKTENSDAFLQFVSEALEELSITVHHKYDI